MDKLTAHTSGAPRPQKQGARPHRGGQLRVGVGGSTGPHAQNGMTGLIILLNLRTLSSDTVSNLPKTHQWSVKINFSFSTINTVIPKPKATLPIRTVSRGSFKGFAGSSMGKESACKCRRHGFNPWSRKIPHTSEQLSPWVTTTETVP